LADPSDKTPQAAELPSKKKPYNTPRLEVYGDLRTITNRVGFRGRVDGLFFVRTA
jgi:hypothetical protein